MYRDTHPVDLGLRGRQRQARFSAIRKKKGNHYITAQRMCVCDFSLCKNEYGSVFVSRAIFTLQLSVSTGISHLFCDSDLNNQRDQQSHFLGHSFSCGLNLMDYVFNLMVETQELQYVGLTLQCSHLQGHSVNPKPFTLSHLS